MRDYPSPPNAPRPRSRGWLLQALAFVVVLAALVVLAWWLLFRTPASSRRPVAETAMVMLPPPPPPPPPPEPDPEPQPEDEAPMPEPEPLEEAPKPAEEPEPTPSENDPVTMDADAQAGSDSFGIQKGSGGGMSGAGGGAGGNATYGRYLGFVLQQAIARDDHVRRLTFQLQLDVWLDAEGVISRVELVRSSGNTESDNAVIEALRNYGRVEERPPPSLRFPARVLVQGRRPAS